MVEAVGLVALLYDVSLGLIQFAADFRETPRVVEGILLQTEILIKQLERPVSERVTENGELVRLVKELEGLSKELRPDGKSRMKKWKQQAAQTLRSDSLHNRLTSFHRRYQAHVNARIVGTQGDVQKSLVSQKETLDAMKEVTAHVDKQINAIRTERLKALNEEILQWLSPTANRSDKHALLVEQHHAGTGAWLYETAEFKAWELRGDDGSPAASPQEGQIQTLWLHGKRECLLSSLIADLAGERRLT